MVSECGRFFCGDKRSGCVTMQKVMTKYWLVVHVGLVLFFSWLGTFQLRGFGLVSLVWLSLFALETAMLLPSVHRGETLADARSRVFRAVVRDPFFYLSVSFFSFVVIQWLNSGCMLIYLPGADIWQFSQPSLSWAPFSVEKRDALVNVSMFAASISGCLCLRHAISQAGKRYLLQAAVLLCGCMAFFTVWQACHGVAPYIGYSLGRTGSAFGALFGFWLIMGMGVFVDAVARKQRGFTVFLALGCLCNLIGMFFFAKPLPLILYTVLAVSVFFYWLLYLHLNSPMHVQLKLFVASVVVMASVVVVIFYVFPENPVVEKLKGAVPVATYWHTLAETKELRANVALKIWQDHPWVGCGADGFRQFVGSVVGDKEWRLIKVDQSYVYNDCLQFLCEFGLLGFGLVLSAVVALLVPICYRTRKAWKNGEAGASGGKSVLLKISPLAITGILATGACFLESWFENPLHSPDVLISWSFVLAMLPAFLPAELHRTV